MDCKEPARPAWVEVNLNYISRNIKEVKKKLSNKALIMGIVKADAYGHGALPICEVLRESGIHSFGVATLPEALELRTNYGDAQIFILGAVLPESNSLLIEKRIDTAVSRYEFARMLSDDAVKAGRNAGIYLAADTGMGTIGYLTHNSNLIAAGIKEITKISELPNLVIKGVFSHFATADEADKSYAFLQYERFSAFCAALHDAKIDVPTKCLANSSAILDIEDAYFDTVRLGLIMYGIYPSDEVNKCLALHPAMSVKAKIVHLKTVPAGTGISYGRNYVTEKERVIATVPIGYADGYPRQTTCGKAMIVNGHYAPVRGNICMDQCMIDVTDIPGVSVGDTVIVMGTDGNLTISAEQIGASAGTIHGEIITGFGLRLEKKYIK